MSEVDPVAPEPLAANPTRRAARRSRDAVDGMAGGPVVLPRRRLTVVGILGETLITAGVVVMLFLGWYVWLDDIVSGEQQQQAAVEVQQELQQQWERSEGVPKPSVDPGEPVVAPLADAGDVFATVIIPRFGEDYVRPITGGVDPASVLNNRQRGIGHYLDTQMPGDLGNFAIAAHRTTYGAPFAQIADLRVGDRVYVETADGWYEYAFRGLEYVWPTGVDVLAPVPTAPTLAATDRVLTMTSCNPRFSTAERIIAYAVLDSWYPRAGGPPAEISTLVEAQN